MKVCFSQQIVVRNTICTRFTGKFIPTWIVNASTLRGRPLNFCGMPKRSTLRALHSQIFITILLSSQYFRFKTIKVQNHCGKLVILYYSLLKYFGFRVSPNYVKLGGISQICRTFPPPKYSWNFISFQCKLMWQLNSKALV